MKTTYHHDGTVTFWSLSAKQWIRCHCLNISDSVLSTMTQKERKRIERMKAAAIEKEKAIAAGTESKCTIKGNHHWIDIEYEIPEWEDDKENGELEACFKYKGNTYFLSEFMRIEPYIKDFKGYDGYLNDTYFSGVVIRLNEEGDAVQAYMFYS